MSLECSICENNVYQGHAKDCKRHPDNERLNMNSENFVINNAPLLNALVDMQESPVYAVRKSVLNSAEMTIVKQEKRITELEKQLANATYRSNSNLDELKRTIKMLHEKEQEFKKLESKKFAKFNNDECWIYQGDSEDKLESLCCPVVINPTVLIELQAQNAELVKFQGQAVPMAETISNLQKQVGELVEALTRIANIAHCGSLIGFLTNFDGMNEIRKLSLNYWDKDECAKLQKALAKKGE